MLTTITVNGSEGVQFLSSLGTRFRGPLPPALAAMVDHATVEPASLDTPVSIEVEAELAEEIAAFVDELVHAGFASTTLPLLFSAQPGDLVLIVRDALAEVQVGKRESRTWRFLARGTRGRLVGRRGDVGKLQLLGDAQGQHAYVSDRIMTRARPIAQRELRAR